MVVVVLQTIPRPEKVGLSTNKFHVQALVTHCFFVMIPSKYWSFPNHNSGKMWNK